MRQMMIVDRINDGDSVILRLEGEIDEDGVKGLRNVLLECLTQNRSRVVLNLSGVRFISYMGVGVLVDRLRQFRACNGDLKLVGVSLYIERLFRMVGVTSLFDIHDCENQALQVFREVA